MGNKLKVSNIISIIFVLLILFVSGTVWADNNGVWHRAEDVRSGIFGSDEGYGNFIFSNNSKIGIGTLNPSGEIEIYRNKEDSFHPAIKISSNEMTTPGKGRGAIQFEDRSTNTSWNVFGSGLVANEGSSKFSINLKEYNGVNKQENMFIIEPKKGNVGIGTTSPEAKLHIFNSNTGPELIVDSSADLCSGIQYATNGITNWAAVSCTDNFYINKKLSDGVTWDYKTFMIQGSSKNVGIGTDSPKAKLDVNGNVLINKNLNVRNSVLINKSLNVRNSVLINKSLNVRNSVLWGTKGVLTPDQGASIELGGEGTPYIDFRNDLTSDSDMRIILANDNKLEINGGVAGQTALGINGGNLVVLGSVTARAFYYNSDKKLKHNIKTIENPLNKILKLRGVKFNWNSDNTSEIGLIAQEVEKVLPELVNTNSETNISSVKYANLVAVLIEAVKEQQKSISFLKRNQLINSQKISKQQIQIDELIKKVNNG